MQFRIVLFVNLIVATATASAGHAQVLPFPETGDILMNNVKMRKHIKARASDSTYKFFQGGPENKHFLLYTVDAEEALGDIELFMDGRSDEIQDAERAGTGE